MSATPSPATWRSERGSDDVADHLHDVQRGLRRERALSPSEGNSSRVDGHPGYAA